MLTGKSQAISDQHQLVLIACCYRCCLTCNLLVQTHEYNLEQDKRMQAERSDQTRSLYTGQDRQQTAEAMKGVLSGRLQSLACSSLFKPVQGFANGSWHHVYQDSSLHTDTIQIL